MGMLRQTPPAPVLDALSREGVGEDRLLLCTCTDIDRLGRYEPQWLAVAEDRLLVVGESAPAEIRFQIDFREVSEFRVQNAVGSGLLQARVGDLYVDVLRYTNRLSDVFQKVARKLDRNLHGQPIVIHPDEEVSDRRCPTCGLGLQFAGDTCPRCVKRGAVLARMWTMMAPYRGSALLIMFMLFCGICLDLVSPQLTRYLVDHVLPHSPSEAMALQNDPAQWARSVDLLFILVLILASVQALRMLVNIVNGILGSRVGTSITFDMRGRLVDHLQQLSIGYYDRQQIGSLVGRVAYDTEALHGFVMQLTNGFLFQLLMVVSVGAMLFTLNPKLAIFTLIPAPLVITGSLFFWRHIYPRYYRFWDASSKQAGMLSGVLSGIRVVKAFNQETREMERFGAASGYLRLSRRGVDYAISTFNPIMTLVFQFGGWIVWFIGGREVLAGEMTLGSLMAFFGYLWMFYGPLTTLTQFTNWLTQFATQAHRIFEILDTPREISDSEKAVSLKDVQGKIEFQGVTFGYSRSAPVLQDVQLEIKAGEMIGIVGRSGSGKSTLVNLMCRFYDVNEGAVLVDGFDVRQIRRDDLLRRIGVVLQEPFLFRGSVLENITYGKPEATVEEVIAAAKASNSHDCIMRAAHGYDTWVGERGAGLSGGERQRIGIARVLLTDPRILILDEATSSVDVESEAAIQAALKEVVKGRTTIAIAHRLSTLRNSDRIVAMDRGRIAEQGTHDELMARNGLYARLVKLQGQMAAPTVDSLAHQQALLGEGDVQVREGGPLPPLRGHAPRWLEPEFAFIHLGNLGALHVTIRDEMIYGGVFAARCMPVQHLERYISLRYFDAEKRETEVGLIRDLAEWPEDARQLVREA